MADEIQDQLYRAIAYEKAAEGLSDSPWLSPILQEASVQIRSSVIEQGALSPDEWDTRKGDALRLSEQQGDAMGSSDTEPTEAEIDEWAIATLSSIYGARVGWETRIGEMPDLDAHNPDQMMAFLDVQRKIEDGDERLSDRAERLYQGLAEQDVEPDEDFARVVQSQYEQWHETVEADPEDMPLDPLTAIDSALSQPHAEVIDTQANPLVSRTADAAMGWLYHIGSNRYESDTNTFDWNPDAQQLTIEGDVSLIVQRHGEQWNDLGSEVDESFVQQLEEHLQSQRKSNFSKVGPAR